MNNEPPALMLDSSCCYGKQGIILEWPNMYDWNTQLAEAYCCIQQYGVRANQHDGMLIDAATNEKLRAYLNKHSTVSLLVCTRKFFNGL